MTSRTKTRKAVQSFDDEVEALRAKVLKDFQFDVLGMQLLEHALDAYRRMLQAKQTLDRDGLVVSDRFGQLKSHPSFEQEQVSRIAFLRHLKSLGCDPGKLIEGAE